jgi:pimeloyl-ACP methyl ester carboxylesterase
MSHPKVSFFTQGERYEHLDSYIIINQAYVQYIRPASTTSASATKLPILFIHGGGLTGAQWEVTPDRRPGWAILASDADYPVYILDAVDSGRSQSAPADTRQGPVEYRTADQIWERFRLGPAGSFEKRELFEGSQVPAEHLDVLLGSQAARRRTTDEVEMKGIIAAIQEIGQCIVVAHSHGAALVMDALGQISHLLDRLVLVEPGETGVASRLLETTPTLLVWGDYLDKHPAWARINAPYNTAPVKTMLLPELGIRGNSHFPMADKNSDEVFAKVLEWIEKM